MLDSGPQLLLIKVLSCVLLGSCSDCITLDCMLSYVVAKCEYSHSGKCSVIGLQCCI